MRGSIVLFVVLLLPLPLVGAADPSSLVTETQEPPLVEWFHGEGYGDVLAQLEAEASLGNIRLLHWRLNAEAEGSSFPDDDAALRAETFGIGAGPAVVVDGRRAEDMNTTAVLDAIDASAPREAWMAYDLRVDVVRLDEGPAVVFEGSITPLHPLSSGTMVLLALTDVSAVDDEGRVAQHLVREMRPEAAFNRTGGTTTEVTWYMTPEHLTAAGVDLASSDLGYVISVLLVDGTDVLDVRSISLPSRVTDHDAGTALSLLPLTVIMVVVLVLFFRSEIATADALPRLVAAPWKQGEEVIVHVAAANANCVLTRIEAMPPWTVRWTRRVDVPAGSTSEVSVRPSRGGEAPLRLEIGLEVDGYGGWVQSLNVERCS